MNDIIILGHINPDVDSIISGYLLEKILLKKGIKAKFIIPDKRIDKDTLLICNKYGLNPNKFMLDIDMNDNNSNYILVDHNKRDLKGNILAIIDHHPNNDTVEVKDYYNENVVSTAYFLARNNEELLDNYDIKLAILASFIDTVSFNSNKGTIEDKKWIKDKCVQYGFNYTEFEQEGLRLTEITDVKENSLNGLKKYDFNGIKVESSYIQIEEINNHKDYIDEIINYLNKYIVINNLDYFVFIVHNMNKLKSMYYLISKDNIEIRYFDNYVARGNTIIPEVEKRLIKKEF